MIKRLGRLLVITGGLVGASLAVPSAVEAQGKIELTPFVGNYYALLTMADDVFGGISPFDSTPDPEFSNWKGRQVSAVAFGGRLTFWISNTIGVEAAAGYARSNVRLSSPGETLTLTFNKGDVLAASGRLLYRPGRLNLHFILGGGIVHRGGETWKGTGKLTRPAGTLGLAARAAVSPKFALNVSAEANVYPFDIDGSGTTNSSKLQSDLVVSIGVPIALSH
jgi:hypothetical protein